LFLSDTLANVIVFTFSFSSAQSCGTVFWICGHLSQNGEETGCPFTDCTRWTLLVKRQRVFPEHTKLLFLWDTLAIFIVFPFSFSSPIFLWHSFLSHL
jgi:hypothetical protein